MATDHGTVLEAVVTRLIDQISELTTKTCFIATEPPDDIPPNVRDNLVCVVSPTDSRFDLGVHDGAGADGTFEYAGVMLTIFSSMKLDRVGHDESLLLDVKRGLYVVKKSILKALSGHNLLDANDNTLLVNWMAPLSCESPRAARDNKHGLTGSFAIVFSTDFDWDLS